MLCPSYTIYISHISQVTTYHYKNIRIGFARSACMTILFLLIIFFLSPSSAVNIPVVSDSGRRSSVEVGFIFQTWLSTHGKSYVNALGEKQRRFEIFTDNLRFVDQHNAKNLSYQLGLTRFADLTVKEYQDLLSGGLDHEPIQRARRVSHRYASLPGDQLPESVDWRKEGAVTAVKDQGSCSKCFLFVFTLSHIISSRWFRQFHFFSQVPIFGPN